MPYQMAATAMTFNDLEGHSLVAGLFKCNPWNIYVAFYTILTDIVLALFLCISRASCRHFWRATPFWRDFCEDNVSACAVGTLILLPVENLSPEMDSATTISYKLRTFR